MTTISAGNVLATRAAATAFVATAAPKLVLAAICLLPLLLYAPFFTEPFEPDEGVYAVVAQGLLRGELPYADYFDHKPPLVYLWYAGSFLVFGEDVLAPRVMVALVWSATTLLIFAEGKLLFSGKAAYAAAAFFAASSGFVMLQASANTEAFMLLPLMGSLYAGTRALKGESPAWLILAGVLAALAALTKQVAVLNLVVLLTFIAATYGVKRDLRAWFQSTSAILGGFIAVVVAGAIPFILAGAAGDFFYANWTYNQLYVSDTSLGVKLGNQWRAILFFTIAAAPLVLVGLAACHLAFQRLPKSALPLLVIGWVLASQVGVLISGFAFPHYYVTLLPSLSLMAGWYVAERLLVRRPSPVGLGLLAIGVVACGSFNAPPFLEDTAAARHAARFPNDHAASEVWRVSSRIGTMSGPDDAIYNYGRASQLYFYADRRPASRFIYDRPFWLDPPTLDEAVEDLRASRPVLIVDTMAPRDHPLWEKAHPPPIRELLETEYEFVERVEFADIYRLKE